MGDLFVGGRHGTDNLKKKKKRFDASGIRTHT
jgi:hypothetical protein